MKDFMDNEENLKEGEETTSVEETTEEVVEETSSVEETSVEETQEVELPTQDSAPTAEPTSFFKQMWKTIVTNKVAALVIAGVALVVSTIVIAVSLVGGGNPPSPSSDNSSTDSSSSVAQNMSTVTFQTNGGSTVEALYVETGTTIDLQQYIPTLANNYFYGWCTDAECTIRASAQFVVEGNVTLYAEWGAEEKYLLSFNTGAGSAIQSVYYKPNDYLQQPEDPTRANYAFAGWYKDAECTKIFSFYTAPQMPKSDMTIYAKWEALNGVIFQTNGGNAMAPIYGVAGEPVEGVVEPEKTDYIFEGWYTDAALTKPYDLVVYPNSVITLYAKWHEQTKNINVTLHCNFADEVKTVALTGNEGENINDTAAIATFTSDINALLKDAYKGTANLAEKPIYNFSAWAYDAMGSQRFNGELPHDATVDLYAVWSRSAAYCELTFVSEDTETVYYVDKNSVVDSAILDAHTEAVKETYEALGCKVEGFYTVSGSRYKDGDEIAMDMRLIPYVYTGNLVFEFATIVTDLGAEVKGYVLKGYDTEGAEANKTKDNLLLLIPEFYEGYPIIWIDDDAFKGFNVKDVTLPDSVLGIGANAFANTKVETMELSSKLYYLGDNAFGNSALKTLEFKSEISNIGTRVFNNTEYEETLPNQNGFVFFNSSMAIVYDYTGSAARVEIPATARMIGGGAFKGNTTMTTLVVSDGVRYASDYAFEGCTNLKTVEIGKAFGSMGKGIFKDCTSLQKVNFTWKYSLSSLGVSMFEGCTALTEINLSELMNLKVVGDRAFFGCSALPGVTFGDSLATVGVSAFENCTSLVYADFGISTEDKQSASNLSVISDRAFAGCSSLKRVILRGELINNAIVSFKKNVFMGAGYNKNGTFVTPILYVKHTTADNWRGDEENRLYTYVEIYQMRLPTEYRNTIEVRAIDSVLPTISTSVVELTAGATLAQFDVFKYLTENGMYTINDDVSYAEDCTVALSVVVNAATQQEVTAVGGKYNLSQAGTYMALLVVEDEFGNQAEAWVTINVNA